MKKIRYIPYGYTMRNGRTVISTEEAEIIREIFKAYLDGASLKAIAEELTGRQIPKEALGHAAHELFEDMGDVGAAAIAKIVVHFNEDVLPKLLRSHLFLFK